MVKTLKLMRQVKGTICIQAFCREYVGKTIIETLCYHKKTITKTIVKRIYLIQVNLTSFSIANISLYICNVSSFVSKWDFLC